MHLAIDHQTVYRYSEPTSHSIQYLRLTPLSAPGQAVRSWTVDAPARMAQWRDAYENIVHVLTIDRPHSEVRVRVFGEVDTEDLNGVYPADNEPVAEAVFLRDTALTEPDDAIRGVAEPLRSLAERDRLNALHRMMNAIRDAMDYRIGETDARTTAPVALAAESGVCQDHAHVFISCARTLGIPARYVSGYLFAGEQDETYTAGHAWAEALVPGLGWVGFDVANRVCPGEAYVRAAVGRDYLDAAPVRGARRGGGDENLDVQVRVAQARHQSQA